MYNLSEINLVGPITGITPESKVPMFDVIMIPWTSGLEKIANGPILIKIRILGLQNKYICIRCRATGFVEINSKFLKNLYNFKLQYNIKVLKYFR